MWALGISTVEQPHLQQLVWSDIGALPAAIAWEPSGNDRKTKFSIYELI